MLSMWGTVVLLLQATTLLPLIDAQNVGTRFQVDTTGTSSNSGSCGWVGQGNIDAIYADTLKLAAAGLDAISKYNQNKRAKRLIDAFFQSKNAKKGLTSSQVTSIKNSFTMVNNWLKNGGTVDDGKLNVVPNLFCHHTWAQPQTMGSQARSQRGRPLFDGNSQPVTLRRSPVLYKDWVELVNNHPTAVPFFSWVHNRYFFDMSYGQGLNDFICTDPTSKAQTTAFNEEFATVTLCPQSFGASITNPTNPTVRALGAVQPVSITLADFKTRLSKKNFNGLQQLEDVTATAVTLYHEIFHLVLGSANGVSVPPNGKEIYGVDGCLKATFNAAVANPETYAYVANAWWVTTNQKDASGSVVEFFQGYTTR